jgi:hypothetical protein
MKSISKYSIQILLTIILFVLLYHVCIIMGIVPYENAWGGRLTSAREMHVFETISIGINLFLAWIILMKANYITKLFSDKVLNIILWIFFFLFLLNTIGNVFAKTLAEKLFSFVTLAFSYFIWKVIQKETTKS